MSAALKGALIEYGTNLIGPLPNVVIFQFNPEALNRVFELPARGGGANDREQSQAGDAVSERRVILDQQYPHSNTSAGRTSPFDQTEPERSGSVWVGRRSLERVDRNPKRSEDDD